MIFLLLFVVMRGAFLRSVAAILLLLMLLFIVIAVPLFETVSFLRVNPVNVSVDVYEVFSEDFYQNLMFLLLHDDLCGNLHIAHADFSML